MSKLQPSQKRVKVEPPGKKIGYCFDLYDLRWPLKNICISFLYFFFIPNRLLKVNQLLLLLLL